MLYHSNRKHTSTQKGELKSRAKPGSATKLPTYGRISHMIPRSTPSHLGNDRIHHLKPGRLLMWNLLPLPPQHPALSVLFIFFPVFSRFTHMAWSPVPGW